MLSRVALAVLFVVAMATSAHAAERAVVVGEVTSSVVRTDFDVRALLHDAAEREIAAMPLARPRSGHSPVIVSVRLASLRTNPTSSACAVTLALRRARTGALFAMLEGSARVDDPSVDGQRTALAAALRSALSRLPAALAD